MACLAPNESTFIGIEFFDKAYKLQSEFLSTIREGILNMKSEFDEVIHQRDNMAVILTQLNNEKETLSMQVKAQALEIKRLQSKAKSSRQNFSTDDSGPCTMVTLNSHDSNIDEGKTLTDTETDGNVSVKVEVDDNNDDVIELHIEEAIDKQNVEQENSSLDQVSSELQSEHEFVESKQSTSKSNTTCNICGERFSYPFQLRAHVSGHYGEKPYKCEFCGAGFMTSSNRNQHRVIHTEEKRHQCEYCSKKFKHYRALRQHLRIHTGEKPFKCPHCNSCFSQSGHLKSHLRIHTREKKHFCSYCYASFFALTNLTRHIRNHHKQHVEQEQSLDNSANYVIVCTSTVS